MNFKTISNSTIARQAAGLVLVLAMVFTLLPARSAAAASPQVTCSTTYTVKSGDYLTKIADAYDVTWYDLAAANDLKSPYVIYVDQKLCIPKTTTTTPDSSTSTGSSSRAKVSVVIDKKEITVKATDMATKSTFFVKVDDAGDRSLVWYKVGVLSTGSSTSATASYKLPEELEDAKSLNVCLKNTTTDANICNNPAYNYGGKSSGSSGTGTSSSSFKGTFTAQLFTKSVVIETSNFPTGSFFFVKVGPAGGRSAENKIGILRTGKSDDVTGTFYLPDELENNDRLNVCLKNLVNNTLKCVVATR